MNPFELAPAANAHQARLQLGELGPQPVYDWHGKEALSRCFSLSVTLVCRSPLPPLTTLLQQPATLELHSPQGTRRYVHGLVFDLTELDRSPRHVRYRLTLVPPLALLDLRRGVRIFQGQTVPDMVERLLTEAGLSADTREWRLNRNYAPRDYCVQYNETELAFIERLLGEEGIHYHFVHRAEDTLLVLADGPEGLDLLPALPFKADTGMAHRTHAITRLTAGPGVRTGKVSLRDYDFTRPALPLQPHSQHLPGPDHADEQPLEDYRWPGSFSSQAQGKQRTDLSLARHRHNHITVTGESNSPQLMAGHYQPLQDHPNPEHNQLWLMTELSYHGKQPQVLGELTDGRSEFHCEFTALPEASVYRPPCPPKPRVPGQQSAMVTGPQGEEIYCDEYGRVKVQFYWDREGRGDENTSTWLRVSQGWAGNGYGQFMLPRVGMEVLVSFIDGDPDRPIITGCLYNGANRVPYALPEHKTRSTFKTASSPRSSGESSDNANELRFEDKAGQEQIYLHAAKDYDQLIDHNKKTEVLNDRHTDTHGHHYGRTRGDHHHTVNGNHHSRTDGDRHEQVGGSRHTELGSQELLKAGREIHLSSGHKVVLDAGAELTLKAGGSMIKLDPSGITLLGPSIKMNSGGSPGQGAGAAVKSALLPGGAEPPIPAQPLYQAEFSPEQLNFVELFMPELGPLQRICQKQQDGSCPLANCPCRAAEGAK